MATDVIQLLVSPQPSTPPTTASPTPRLVVVLDLDETLIYSEPWSAEAARRYDAVGDDATVDAPAVRGVRMTAAGALTLPPSDSRRWYVCHGMLVQPRNGVVNFLETLLDGAACVAVWSHASAAWLETNLRHLLTVRNLRRLVFWHSSKAAVRMGSDGGSGRPLKPISDKSSDPFLAALGFAPWSTILVDDTNNLPVGEQRQWLRVPKATGAPDDATLPQLAPFLADLAQQSKRPGFDVRTVDLKAWRR
jgi:hypothetical protein